MDDSLRQLFATLEDADVLSNTLMFGAGDHGETPGELYKRLGAVDAPILDIPLWAHIPERFVSVEERRNLIANQQRTVSILDIAPTVRSILGSELYTQEER
jgi:arylsulfatase A-like enzyme